MINIKDFISDLKQYILTSFEQNANFSNIKVAMAYDSENTIKTPQVSISINNNREDDSSNSYDSENISILRVVLYCYNKAMIFDNDTEKTSAILSTTILTNEIQNIFDKNLFPRPSPVDAPLTSPAISTISSCVGIILSAPAVFARLCKVASGTTTRPVFGSIVQNG